MAEPPAERGAVVFANLSRGWGGGEQWHCALAQGLARRGWRVEIIAHRDGVLAEQAQALALPLWPLTLRAGGLAGGLASPWQLLRLQRHLGRLRPGAVIVNGMAELRSVGTVARLAGARQVLLRQGLPVPLLQGWLDGVLLRHVANRLIVNSQATLDVVRAAAPALVDRLRPRVIYHGVDPAGFQPVRTDSAAPQARPRRAPGTRIAVLGRLEWDKGVDRAIQALARVRERVPEATLRIVGEGSQRAALDRMAQGLGLTGAVQFVAPGRRVTETLRDCDVLALPSRQEGFAYALVEAMLMELPAVAFDLPAAREIIVDGVTGLIVPADDVDALARALAELLASPARARDLGMAGRLRALSQFTLDRAISELEHLLQER